MITVTMAAQTDTVVFYVSPTGNDSAVGKEIVYRAYKDEKIKVVGGGAPPPLVFTSKYFWT